MTPNKRRLFLIDVSGFIFRAFFAIQNLSTSKGHPTNATYGFLSMLLKVLEHHKPDGVICVFDSKEPSFRKEEYAEYKANRGAPPDLLIPQFADVDRAVETLGLWRLRQSGFEADDLIAAAARHYSDWQISIVSSDKDLMQLVDDRVHMLDTMKDIDYGPAEVEAKMGVPPSLVADYLGLIGDSSDNIPGVPGVGPKTAVELLKEYGSMEAVLAAAPRMKGKRAETLQNHAEDARLSKRLATVRADIDLDGKLPQSEKELAPPHPGSMPQAFGDLMLTLELKSLAKKYGFGAEVTISQEASTGIVASSSSAVTTGLQQGVTHVISTEQEWKHCIDKLQAVNEFGFWMEPTETESHKRTALAVALAMPSGECFYLPRPHKGQMAALLDLIETKNAVTHDIKDPLRFFLAMGLTPQFPGVGERPRWSDTRIAQYLVDAEEKLEIEPLASRVLEQALPSRDEILGKGGLWSALEGAAAAHAAGLWALTSLRLKATLEQRLKDMGSEKLYREVELPVALVLARMEQTGIAVDPEVLAGLSVEYQTEITSLERELYELAGGEFNLNSPKQLAVVLFDKLKLPVVKKTKTGFSTDAEVMEKLAPLHAVPARILRYRELTKLKGTYIDVLPGLIESDGRVHGRFNQTVAATGRLSGSDPNLQNIPIKTDSGRRIRRAFVAQSGSVLVGADYSQVELRIVAHLSGDEALLNAFREGKDVHRATAAEIFAVSETSVTAEQRSIAKAINFGLIYGKTAFGLAQELGISRSEAQAYIDSYFKRYSAVRDFMNEAMERARTTGYAQTLFGRRRPIRDMTSKNMAVRNAAERMAMNTPVQGTAADIMKMAMVSVARNADKAGARIILQVHDELVQEVEQNQANETLHALKNDMMGAAHLSVPLEVSAGIATNWMDLS